MVNGEVPGLNPIQQQVVSSGLLDTGFPCLLQMATGSGKTWLAKQAIKKTLANGFRAIYLSPTRALAEETYRDLKLEMPEQPLGIFTGDYGTAGNAPPIPLSKAQLLVMTPERLDACCRHWRSHWDWLPEVDLVVVDEFHLIGDRHRGARLEGLIGRLRRLNPFMRLLGLSATLGNREELADWLEGVEFHSTWRPVPLNWRVAHFRKADEKPALVVREAADNIANGGKSLVFVQSRRRAEFVAAHLKSVGLRAAFHHAGLGRDERIEVEGAFRGGDTDVLVATATLEVGLNFPVRQVILYDLQEFDGEDFVPLSVTSVWQRVGRAGRPGLDEVGEAVLLLPSWGRASHTRYERGDFERCLSSLAHSAALNEQIVVEIGSGFARTRTELRSALSQSLAARQGRLSDVNPAIDELLKADLLREGQRAEGDEREVRLKATPLGRLVVRHMLSPKTVLILRQALTSFSDLYRFDLLLAACCVPDAEPVLTVGFEELEELRSAAGCVSSRLLAATLKVLLASFDVPPRRLLAGVKAALSLTDWADYGDLDSTARKFGCYVAELRRLLESVDRILLGLSGLVKHLAVPTEDESERTLDGARIASQVRLLRAMLTSGIDADAAALTFVDGIGPAWARRLQSAGARDLEDLAQARPEDLAETLPLSAKRASRWIEAAGKLLSTELMIDYRESADRRGPASSLLCVRRPVCTNGADFDSPSWPT